MVSKPLEELQNARIDTAVSIAKGIFGAIPYGGAIFAEVIGMTIPNQRLDRIVQFLKELDLRLEDFERKQLQGNAYAIDLFEEGVVQASRALSKDRNRFIAIFLSKSINVNADSYGIKKKLFYILHELTDKDVDILRSISVDGYRAAARKYYPGHLTVGTYDKLSKDEKYEYDSKQVSWVAHIATLERLGLLSAERQMPDLDGNAHHIDEETMLPKVIGYCVTKLGNVFLHSIDE